MSSIEHRDPTMSMVPAPAQGGLPTIPYDTGHTSMLMRLGGGGGESGDTAATPASATGETPEGAFTPYRLHRVVGRGGMGEVWAAEQVSLGRQVAVKRLLARHDSESRDAIRAANFRHEAHIAGLLEHPHILPVHDLGHDASGNPLLVMKLIEGRSWASQLDADWKALPPDEHLSRHIPILMAMTQAVAFAHSKGIVHRDLKPAQVMIGAFGEVVLTDWGLAIRVDESPEARQRREDRTPTTQPWNLPTPGTASNPAGTPAMMAPEQTLHDSSWIGPRTDVYLLGGTLYRLLTGQFPHLGATSQEAMERAASGVIDPPSQRVPNRPIPRDLEELCLAALRPNPEDRVASAEAFWQALDDHVRGSTRRARSREKTGEAAAALDARPRDYAAYAEVLASIEEARRLWSDNPACDPLKTRALAGSAREALTNGDLALARLQAASIPDRSIAAPIEADVARAEAGVQRRRAKFRAAVASVVVLLAVIAGGALVFSQQMQAKNEELESRTREAVDARARAEKNLEIAKRQSDGAFGLVDFVLRDLRTAMEEELTVERGITVPVANEVSHAIAGRVAEPIVEYFEAVPVDEIETWPRELLLSRAEQMHTVGWRFKELGRFDEAVRLSSPTLELRRAVLGPEDPLTAESMSAVATMISARGDLKGALALEEAAYAIREKSLPPDDPDIAVSLNNLAILAGDLGDLQKSHDLHRRALDIEERQFGPDDPRVAGGLANLGVELGILGKYDEARAAMVRAISILEKSPSAKPLEKARVQSAFANIERETGDLARARELMEAALAIREAEMGPNHYETARSLGSLAALLRDMGEYDAARPLLDRALSINEKCFGPDHTTTIGNVNGLAVLLMTQGHWEEARPLMERVVAASERTYGPDHPRTSSALNNIAILYRETFDYAASRSAFERALAIREKVFGPEHPLVAETLGNYSLLMMDTGDFESARAMSARAVAINEKIFGVGNPGTALGLNNLAMATCAVGDRETARALADRALTIARSAFSEDHQTVLALQANSFRVITHQARAQAEGGDTEAATATAREALERLGDGPALRGASKYTKALRAEALWLAGDTDEATSATRALATAGYPDSDRTVWPADRAAFLRLCATLGVEVPQPGASPAAKEPDEAPEGADAAQ